jgi:type IV fimbrial biogenesis protein FimT
MLTFSLKSKVQGFSLIEMMVSIAIIAVLASMASSSYKAWVQNARIRTAAESIQNGIQVARAEAVKRNSPVQFDLRSTHSAWTVCMRPAGLGSCPVDDATTIQSRAAGEGSSADIAVSAVDAGPYVFNSFGAMISPAPSAADGLVRIGVDVSTSVLPAAESRNLNIIIGVGGSVRMCDPDSGLSATDPRKCPA